MRLKSIHSLRAAILSVIGISIIAFLSALTQKPFLFPSLGPTIFVITLAPHEPIARFRNIVFGHFAGIVAGIIAILISGVFQDQCSASVICLEFIPGLAAALAVAFTILLQLAVNAVHPPAAATTMLLVLGGTSIDLTSCIIIMASVLFVAVYGELLKYVAKAFQQ